MVQLEQPGPDPMLPVRKIPPGSRIDATQELAPHASGDDMVVR